MFPVFALIFLLVPVIEIFFLIQVGQVIGALWTVFFVVLTAVIGVHLLKQQGLSTLNRAQSKMNDGSLPAQELLEGIALLVAGAFLLTPGFVTDAFGFILLIPVTRALLLHGAVERLKASGRFTTVSNMGQPSQQNGDNVIDGVHYRHDNEESR